MVLRNQYFLLRHGENAWSKTGRSYPWPDGDKVRLTRNGIGQIKKAAEVLKKEKIDLIYSSDLFRTRQSAEIAAKVLGIKRIIFDKRLRDTLMGVYQNRPKKEFYKDFPDPEKRFRLKPKNGESWNEVKQRVKKFLLETEKKNKGKKILIVGHGDPFWLLEGIINNLDNNGLLRQIFGDEQNYIKKGELRKL